MNTYLLFAQLGFPDGNKVGELVLKALAVAGVALLGYLGTWLAVTLLARSVFTGKIPKPVMQILQGAGGIAAGVVAYLILFSNIGGGPGPGGPGVDGPGGGGGTGSVPGTTPTTKSEKPPDGQGSTSVGDPGKGKDVLQIEVLPRGGTGDPIYRVKGEDKAFNLKDLSAEIDRRQTENKNLAKLEILHYENSPDVPKQQVKELERLAGLKAMTPSLTKMTGNAP